MHTRLPTCFCVSANREDARGEELADELAAWHHPRHALGHGERSLLAVLLREAQAEEDGDCNDEDNDDGNHDADEDTHGQAG